MAVPPKGQRATGEAGLGDAVLAAEIERIARLQVGGDGHRGAGHVAGVDGIHLDAVVDRHRIGPGRVQSRTAAGRDRRSRESSRRPCR